MAVRYFICLVVLIASSCVSLLTDTIFTRINLDHMITKEYSLLFDDVSLGECGMKCIWYPECKLFYYDHHACYILNMGNNGLTSINISSFHADQDLKEQCNHIPGYASYIDGLFCLKIYNDNATDWFSAKTTCEQDGGQLLTITTEKFSFLQDILLNLTGWKYWLGASDLDIEGSVMWVDGSPLAIDLWATNQPDDPINGTEDCVEMWINLKTNDQLCSFQNNFICEHPLSIKF